MSVIASFQNVEVQEVGGESFSKVAQGTLNIVKNTDNNVPAILQVDNVQVEFRKDAPNGPFKKLDSRTFIMSTQDIMSFYYVALPKDISAEDLETAEYVMNQLAKGLDPTPLPKPAPQPAAAPAVGAAAQSASDAAAAPAAANNPLGQFGNMLQGLAQRAAQDTQLLGEIAQKAAADTMLVAGQGAKALQGLAANQAGGKPAPAKP